MPSDYGVSLPWNFFLGKFATPDSNMQRSGSGRSLTSLQSSTLLDSEDEERIEDEQNRNENFETEQHMQEDIAVNVRSLTKFYKKPVSILKRIKNLFKSSEEDTTRAVNQVSFRIYEGEVFGLSGHNGAGKLLFCFFEI